MKFLSYANQPIFQTLKVSRRSPCRNCWIFCLRFCSYSRRSNVLGPDQQGYPRQITSPCSKKRSYCDKVEQVLYHGLNGFARAPFSTGFLIQQNPSHSREKVQHFHTTPKRSAIPVVGPILIKLASPLSRLGAVLLGRQLRKWWRNLPDSDRAKLYNNARKRSDRLLIAVFGTLGICFGYYSYHLEENSITGRKQFMIMNEHQIVELAEKEFISLSEEMKGSFLPPSHPSYQRVSNITRRILKSNMSNEVTKKSWRVNVVDNDMVNAFVLPNGEIFVMRGMLETVANDDELAGILGHEIAHAILNHPAEQLSFSGFASIFNMIILTLLWTVVPSDSLAVLFNWIESMLQDILIHLPYQRDLEKEADCVGLYLAARACFDVRKISDFWERMDKLEEKDAGLEWLSTHPSNSKRFHWINDWMPQALDIRKASNCPEILPFFERVKQLLKF